MWERVRCSAPAASSTAPLPGADLAHHQPSCHGCRRPLCGVEAAMEATAVPRVMPLAESRRTQLILTATSIVATTRLLRSCENREMAMGG